ncbi:MAG: M23 family metallopeptidase [Clostridia bacterium]|nr:M23 family metallopeptidase [Clostridia bacterium]
MLCIIIVSKANNSLAITFERIFEMEENDKKNSRIFYLTLAVVLTVVAIIVIAITVARRNVPSGITGGGSGSVITEDSGDQSTGLEDKNKLPSFALPIESCQLDVDFSDTVLVFSQTMGDYRTHMGIDLSCELGQEVMAVADGVIKNIWNDPFMGTCISIEHTGNAISYYKNLDPVVKEGIVIGASVSQGDVIGAVGESAMNEISQDPHLHLELKVNDKQVDPKDHIKLPTPQVKPEDQNKEN